MSVNDTVILDISEILDNIYICIFLVFGHVEKNT